MLRAIEFAALCGAACGAALIGSRMYYGGWVQPFGKYAVWLEVRSQPHVYNQTKPCCARHGGRVVCGLGYYAREFSHQYPLTLNAANIIETKNPECARNLLCYRLFCNYENVTSCTQLTYKQTLEQRAQLDLPAWILRELGAVPPSPNAPNASILAYDMLEDCLRFLPAGVCIVIHDWGNTIPLSSNVWMLQRLCEKTNVTIVIIERTRT
jgi:hypothetical protein